VTQTPADDQSSEETLSDVTDTLDEPSTDQSETIKVTEYTLRKLVRRRGNELEYFRAFLSMHASSLDLHCWLDVEDFKSERDGRRKEAKAWDIKDLYLNDKYFFGANSPASKEGQQLVNTI